MSFKYRGRRKKKVKSEKLSFKQHCLNIFILVVLVFGAIIFQAGFMPHEHSDESLSMTLLSPMVTPPPDPIIKENEQIKVELEELQQENVKMTEYVMASRGATNRKTKEVLNYDKLSAPRYIVELMERMCLSHGFEGIGEIYSIIAYESRFDTTCHATKGEDSRGLLQVNVADKAHARRNPNKNKLFDPAYNLDYQLDELKVYYKSGKNRGLKRAELAMFISRYGQRPRWSNSIEQNIRKYYKEYQNAIVKI